MLCHSRRLYKACAKMVSIRLMMQYPCIRIDKRHRQAMARAKESLQTNRWSFIVRKARREAKRAGRHEGQGEGDEGGEGGDKEGTIASQLLYMRHEYGMVWLILLCNSAGFKVSRTEGRRRPRRNGMRRWRRRCIGSGLSDSRGGRRRIRCSSLENEEITSPDEN